MDSQSALETRNETVIQVWRNGLELRPSDHARLDKPVGEVIVGFRKAMSRNPGILIALGAALLFGASIGTDTRG